MLRWILLLAFVVIIIEGRTYLPKGYATHLGYYPTGRSIENVDGITEPSQCFEACVKRKSFERRCFGATYDFNTGNCHLHTDYNEVCFGKWRRDGRNIMHISNAKCIPSKRPNAISGYGKNAAVCNNLAIQRFVNTHSLNGVLQSGINTELACLVFCLGNSACWAADYDTSTNQCFIHSVAINASNSQPLSGVVQYRKVCPTLVTNVNPFATQTTTAGATTTTTTAATTAPTVVTPTIADNGICPSPFEMLANTTQGAPGTGTQQVATVNTTELCKRECLNSATCVAADFNTNTNLCFFHTASSVTTLMRGTQSCCIHFRKLNCAAMMVRQCWSQSTTVAGGSLVTIPDSLYVGQGTNAQLSMVTCTGVCTFSITQTITTAPITGDTMITRGCDTTIPFSTPLNCPQPVTSGTPNSNGFTSTQTYSCSDSLCNFFTRTEAANMLLYLPFDQTLDDHSTFMRNGYFWNGTMGGFLYDSFDRQKNKSALFSGMEMVCAPLNNINLNPNSIGLTLTSFVKREATTPSVMTIFSKGTTNTNANTTELFKLSSTFQSPDMHIYTFSITLDMTYSCSTTTAVPINEWQFVAARVRVDATPNAIIDLFVIREGSIAGTANLDTPTISCTLSAPAAVVTQVGLNVTSDPFCVGGSYVNEDFTPIQGTTDFFTGHIDEVRLFRGTIQDISIINSLPLLSILNNRVP